MAKMRKPKEMMIEVEEEVSMKPKKRKKRKMGESKIEKVLHEFKEGKLHSGSKKGPKVKSRKQAVAIALSEARNAKKKKKKSKKDSDGY